MKKRTANSKPGPCSTLLFLSSLVLFFAWPTAVGGRQEAPAKVAFHHVHLNSVDPAAAINFYTKTFDVTKKNLLAGMPGVQSENMYLLFNRVPRSPATAPGWPGSPG